MADKTYHPQAHTMVRVRGLEGLRGIVLVPGLRVWIEASYNDVPPSTSIPVGDGTNDGYDQMGNRILSVPIDLCTFYTADEAQQIWDAEYADAQLLRYAIG